MAGGMQRLAASMDAGSVNEANTQNLQQQQQQPLISRAKLQELISTVSLGERLDPSVEQMLVKLAESFVVEVASGAADLARHRRSQVLETRDLQLYLEREYDIGVPGFVDNEEKTAVKLPHPTVGHQTRSAHATRAASAASSQQQQQQQQQQH